MATKIIEVAQDNTFVAKLKYKSSFAWYVFNPNIWKNFDSQNDTHFIIYEICQKNPQLTQFPKEWEEIKSNFAFHKEARIY